MTSTQTPATQLPAPWNTIPQPPNTRITYINENVQAPYDHSVYHDGQVIVIEGPGGTYSIEAQGETSHQAGNTTLHTPEQFRTHYPHGHIPNDGDKITTNKHQHDKHQHDKHQDDDTYYTYLLTNWFDITIVPNNPNDEWEPLGYAFTTLTDAITETCTLASQHTNNK